MIGDATGVTIACRGTELRAGRAIVAVPPPLRGRIDFGAAADQLLVAERVPLGRLVKCAAVYAEPFWRADRLSGEVAERHRARWPHFRQLAALGAPGVLLGFVGGAPARRFGELAERERREAVLACFARIFGERRRAPERYIEQDWGTRALERRRPHVRHGTRRVDARRARPSRTSRRPASASRGPRPARRWAGFIDGAVRSGEARRALCRRSRLHSSSVLELAATVEPDVPAIPFRCLRPARRTERVADLGPTSAVTRSCRRGRPR